MVFITGIIGIVLGLALGFTLLTMWLNEDDADTEMPYWCDRHGGYTASGKACHVCDTDDTPLRPAD